MLRTMLNTHPDLAIPRETRFLLESWGKRVKYGDLRADDNRRRLAEDIVVNEDSWFGRLDVDKDMAVQRLMAAPPTIGSLLGTAFALYAERDGKARWGDKRPTLVLNLRAIYSMFPDAQFVNIVRDPRAAVASMKKLGWYNGNVGGGVELWLNCVKAARKGGQQYRPDQLLSIQYEDLVRDPRGGLSAIADFLTLDRTHMDTMLSFHENVDEPVSEYHNRLDQPVNDAPVEGWRNELSDAEVTFIEEQTGRLMDVYGYERVGVSAPVPDEIRQVFAERQRVRQRRRLGEAKRTLQYRYPVAARLTTGQQRRYNVTRPLERVRRRQLRTDG